MRLQEWTDEQRAAFNRFRAEQYGIKDSMKKVMALYEDLHVYPYITVQKYTASPQGRQS
jgi:hypothetical protein